MQAELLTDVFILFGINAAFFPDEIEVMLHGKSIERNFLQLPGCQLAFYGNLVEEGNPAVLQQEPDDRMHIAHLGIAPEILYVHAVQGQIAVENVAGT